MRYNSMLFGAIVWGISGGFNAAFAQPNSIALSIYQNGTALVRDEQTVFLKQGENSIAFQNVAEKILPETAFVEGQNIQVLEQNYNFDLLTPVNIVDESVGKTVKTALFDESSGKTIFNTAKIIDSRYGRPILEFDYGIDVNFPGRLIFDKLPDNLVSAPTLSAEIIAAQSGEQPLVLTYLTKGLSWKADYIAELNSDEYLTLRGWITLNNQSGSDYKNAKLQFIAGDVNQVTSNIAPRALMLAAGSPTADAAMMNKTAVVNQTPQALGDYYLYSLPFQTDVLNNQSKQVSLLEKPQVTFEKEYRLSSPLYLWNGLTGGAFEQQSPDILIKLTNDKKFGLGEVLPQGIVRFYDKTKSDVLQFIGEQNFAKLAVGEKSELRLGKAFDLSVSGKVINVQKINDSTVDAEVEVVFHNAATQNESVSFVQNFNSLWKILAQSADMVEKTAEKARWIIKVPAQGEAKLSYKVRLSSVQNQN